MKKKRVLNKRKLFLFLLIVFAIICVIIFGVLIIKNLHKEVKEKDEKPIVNVKDTIEEYGYNLDDNETKYYNDLFSNLKDILNSESIDEKSYAEIIAKLFVTDYFNLDNKITNTDIGGVQFVYESFREDFINISKTGMYDYIESNVYEDRKQELPVVDNVEVISNVRESYSYLDTSDEAYKITLKINYKKDLGYQQDVTVYLVHNGLKLEIVEMK